MEEAMVKAGDEGEDVALTSDGGEIGGLVDGDFAADLRRGTGLLAMDEGEGDLVRSNPDFLADDGLELLEAEGRVDGDGADVDLPLVEEYDREGGGGVDLGGLPTTADADSHVHAGDAVAPKEKDGLEGLVAKDPCLEGVDREHHGVLDDTGNGAGDHELPEVDAVLGDPELFGGHHGEEDRRCGRPRAKDRKGTEGGHGRRLGREGTNRKRRQRT